MSSHDYNHNYIDFIDRSYYRTLIGTTYDEIIKNPIDLKIISLYGPGGFGKTSLLKDCLMKMNNPKAKPIHISLEITDKDDKLDILIKFRRALPKHYSYPLFDYAILFLWNSLNTSQIDDKYFGFIQQSYGQLFKSTMDIAVTALTAPTPYGIAAGSIIELMSQIKTDLSKKYQKQKLERIIGDIENTEPHDLVDLLPELLGNDIYKAFLNKTLVFIIDSYQKYSSSLLDSVSWLTTLIENIGYGFYVITSREFISWPPKIKKNVISKKLDELPVAEVRQELENKFKFDLDLIENIINTTGCIPIYLDLAIRSLEINDIDTPFDEKIYFKNKEDIIKKFLIHLPNNEQDAIKVLAIVRIFNKEIFEFLVKDLQLSVSILSFESICQRSLIRNLEYDNCFYKIHDIISKNISKTQEKTVIKHIFSSYLMVIRDRIIYKCTNIQIRMLFKHLLSLIIDNKLSLSQSETENILDIYFFIKEALLPFSCDEVIGFASYQPLNHIYYFIKTLSEERENSNIRLNYLKEIHNNSSKLGKHIKSYQLMYGYLQALCESCEYLKEVVEKLNLELSDSEKQEWYYGQTKIFFGDCNISYGNFKSGIKELRSYEQLVPALIEKKNDAFQITRHIAHGYRFNMLLDKAEVLYRSLIEGDNILPTPLQKVYIFTNLCETYCYFKPDEIFKIKNKALFLAKKFKDLKSQGKIHYSLAIACLVKKEYKAAIQHITESIQCNQQDGYLAGQLYAYMAQAYYEYALHELVCDSTVNIINNIMDEIKVYKYFSLPLAMMQKNFSALKQIGQEFEWLDYNKTLLEYRRFLDSIQISET